MAGLLSVVYLIVEPSSADHAAQVFRSGLFESEGLSAWNNLWFGGHHLPGYSVLFPLLASLIGPRVLGALAVVAAALLFAAIAYRRWGDRARLGVDLVRGRRVRSASSAAGSPSPSEARSHSPRCSPRSAAGARSRVGFAVLCPLASPVAALFLACGAMAHSLAERSRSGLELAAAGLGAAVADERWPSRRAAPSRSCCPASSRPC